DVIDVGRSWAEDAMANRQLTLYQVGAWGSIPDAAKDPAGHWYGDYSGTIVFEVNTTVVNQAPRDWADLLSSEYRGMVALAGAATTSNQAMGSVWAGGMSNGSTLDDGTAGLAFFRQLSGAGTLRHGAATAADVASGAAPIRLAWSYTAVADQQFYKAT